VTLFEATLQDWSRQVESSQERFAAIAESIAISSGQDPAVFGYLESRELPKSLNGLSQSVSFRILSNEPRAGVQCRFSEDGFSKLISGECSLRELWRDHRVKLNGEVSGILSLQRFLHLVGVEPLNTPTDGA